MKKIFLLIIILSLSGCSNSAAEPKQSSDFEFHGYGRCGTSNTLN